MDKLPAERAKKATDWDVYPHFSCCENTTKNNPGACTKLLLVQMDQLRSTLTFNHGPKLPAESVLALGWAVLDQDECNVANQ